MALTVGTDTYATALEFETYAEDFNLTITSYSDEDIEAALKRATSYLDSAFTWRGQIWDTDTPQALSWPRRYVYDHEGRDLSSGTVPTKIKNAQCEIAYRELNEDITLTDNLEQVAEEERVGPLSVKWRISSASSPRNAIDDWLRVSLKGLYIEHSFGFNISRV